MTMRSFSAKEAEDFWLAFDKQPDHPLSCLDDECLYFSQPKKPRYSRRTFYIGGLVHRIKMVWLIKNKKAQEVKIGGERFWKINRSDYKQAPFNARLRKILAFVHDHTFDDSLIDPSAHDSIANYIKRSSADKFTDFKDILTSNRRRSWLATRPDLWKAWERNRPILLIQRIADFIRSRSGREVSQRDLERRFSNKRKAELDRAFEWLWFYPSIKRHKKGKSVIFSWQPPTREEIRNALKETIEIDNN